ncbi:SDR family oxidoreductase [candidate division KSB1 bacterium]|nr:SDR family oxidoreductase [candidate division KSB1 bacterium]
MELNLSSKVVLVCGASQGIGFATAREFANEGASVIICSRNKKRIEQAAKQILQTTNKTVLPFPADLSRTNEIDALISFIHSKFSRVDVLVNNAGGPPPGAYLEFDQQDWKAAFDLTFTSANYLTHQLLPGMVDQQWGRIINLTSITVKQPIDNLVFSNAMRLAVVGWAKTLSNQFGKDGITVNNIATGRIRTERLSKLAETSAKAQGMTSDDIFNGWISQIPVGRLGTPEEIAWMVLYLASEKAGFITGTTISVDGGENKGIF